MKFWVDSGIWAENAYGNNSKSSYFWNQDLLMNILTDTICGCDEDYHELL